MAMTSRGYTFDFDNTVEIGGFPAHFVTKGNTLGAVVIMVFGLMWGGAGAVITWGLIAEPFPASLIPFGPMVIGVGLFLFGLYAALLRVETTIDSGVVTIRRRRWFSTRVHVQPLGDYPGILRLRVTYHRNKQTHVAWIAALPHDDRDKRVVLAASNDEAEGRRLVEDYARWLDMPALEETADGYQRREPGDVDRSLADLAADGKIETHYKDRGRPPAELHVERGADMIVVSFLKAALPLKLVVAIAAVAAAGVVALFVAETDISVGIAAPAIGAFIVAVVLFLMLGHMTARRQLILRRDRIVIASLAGKNREPRVSAEMTLDEIEGVRVARGHLGGLALWFDTDRGSFPAGDNSPRPALDYARDLVIAAVATAKDGPPRDET